MNTNTKYGYGRFGAVSVVQVPGDGPQFYDVKPVPHGEVRIRPYISKTLGVSRTAWVYTPPGYDKGSNFPVLYLLHGAGDIESGWTMIGRANNIIDNAIAEGKAKPMVVVMPLGHAIQSFWTGAAKQVPDPVAKSMAGMTLAEIINSMMGGDGKGGLSPVTKDIVEDVLPMIESTYKVSKRPEDRAIAGLSMGGGHSINISFVRPELFRYVALMSPAAGSGVAKMYPRIAEKPDILNKQFKLLWVGVGKDDTLTGPGDKAFDEALTTIGVKHDVRPDRRPSRVDSLAALSQRHRAAAVQVMSACGMFELGWGRLIPDCLSAAPAAVAERVCAKRRERGWGPREH